MDKKKITSQEMMPKKIKMQIVIKIQLKSYFFLCNIQICRSCSFFFYKSLFINAALCCKRAVYI